MKKISISTDFKIYDIGKIREVENIIEKIDINNTIDIELDLTDCLIDYPATGMLIDKILFQLLEQKSESKKLKIIYDCNLSKGTLLNWLFLGSKFFDIMAKKELDPTELDPIISLKAKENNISITIQVQNEGKEIISYIYE